MVIARNPNSRENCDRSNTIYESGTVGKTAYITQPATEIAKALDGAYAGFQPKPAVEVIIVAMKPCTERTYTEQSEANCKGVTWLDDCRIPNNKNGIGRFPANLIVSDSVLGKHSKFFDLNRWAEEDLPFICVPKASPKEKEAGLEDLAETPIAGRDPGQDLRNVPFKTRTNVRRNQHPTVKPLKLMAYLITMGSREGEIVLDPFLGSGSTCIAAMMLNRDFIGVEISAEYHQIALKRLEHYRLQMAAA